MQPLPTVYAYGDDGPLIEGTRWEPRKVFCTLKPNHEDAPGIRYVVKLRRGTSESAAASISEVVCWALLRQMNIRTLQAALVSVSADMARNFAQKTGYNVDANLHFGTVLDIDTESGPPLLWEQMSDPQELVDIWVADCWMMNIDRDVEGNIRLAHDGKGTFRLLAADQSDCFLGSGRLAGGSCFGECPKKGAAPYPAPFVDRAIMEFGCNRLHQTLGRIAEAAQSIPAMTELVPTAWWTQANVNPEDVVRCLMNRADRIREIIGIERLEGISHVSTSNIPLF